LSVDHHRKLHINALRAIFCLAAKLAQSGVSRNIGTTPGQGVAIFAVVNLHELRVRQEVQAFEHNDLRTSVAGIDDATECNSSGIERSNCESGDRRRRVVERGRIIGVEKDWGGQYTRTIRSEAKLATTTTRHLTEHRLILQKGREKERINKKRKRTKGGRKRRTRK
jgi:hypothetical protein